MMRSSAARAAGLLLVPALALAACDRGTEPPSVPVAGADVPEAAAAGTTRRADTAPVSFVGMWTAPEGLSFVVERTADGLRVRNQYTIDDKATFAATAAGATLRFVRGGQAFVARPGTGAETGFKWLLNKRDCLIVQVGTEGYCRD